MDSMADRYARPRPNELPPLRLTLRTATPRRGVTVVAAAGECDLHDAERLREALVDAGADGETRVLLDLSELAFADSSTLAALLKAQRALAGLGSELVLVAPSAAVERTIAVAGLDGRFRTLESIGGDRGEEREPAPPRKSSTETAAMFRAVNERILELSAQWGDDGPVEFVCECPDTSCMRPVAVPRETYERVRSAPDDLAIVHRSHDDGGAWDVVEAGGEHLVVRAAGGASG